MLTPQQVQQARTQLNLGNPSQAGGTTTDWSSPDAFKVQTPQPQSQPTPNVRGLEEPVQTPRSLPSIFTDYAKNLWGDISNAGKEEAQSFQEGQQIASKGGVGNFFRGLFDATVGATGANARGSVAPFSALGNTLLPPKEGEKPGDTIARGAIAGSPFGAPGMVFGGAVSAIHMGMQGALKLVETNPKIAQFLQDNPDIMHDINNTIDTGFGIMAVHGVANAPEAQPPAEGQVSDYFAQHTVEDLSQFAKDAGNPELADKIASLEVPKGITPSQLRDNIISELTPQESKLVMPHLQDRLNELNNPDLAKVDLSKQPTEGQPAGTETQPALVEGAKPQTVKVQNIDNFTKDATPAFSKKLIGEPNIKNEDGTTTPRVSEGTMGRTVNSTPLEKEAGKVLSEVPNYPEKGTNLQKYQAVQPEIAKEGNALVESLKSEKALKTPKQLVKIVNDAVSKVPDSSLLLQKSDPVIKNYMRVAANAAKNSDGTLVGELKFSQALDKAYENARGKLAFGSDKISALDEVHTASRNALKQDLIDSAKSTDVKASLKKQWDLFRASDVLREKAETEGNSTVQRLIKKYPITSKIATGAARAVGVGGAIDVLK